MAYALVRNSRQWRGFSTDAKPIEEPPSGPGEADTLVEIDTGKRFVRHNGTWLRQEQTIESLLQELIELNREALAVLQATHSGHEEHLWQSEMPVESL